MSGIRGKRYRRMRTANKGIRARKKRAANRGIRAKRRRTANRGVRARRKRTGLCHIHIKLQRGSRTRHYKPFRSACICSSFGSCYCIGLDRPITTLNIKEKRQIKNHLGGRDTSGYFYWQSVAEELGFQNESRGWERADNPIESLLKAYGEKEGSTIRGLIEAIRGAGLEDCAKDLEDILANDNSASVDITSVLGKENGATVYLTSDKGKINNKADSVMNVPKYTGEETNANDIADTAV